MTDQTISELLDVNRAPKKPFGQKSDKTLYRITNNPSTGSPGETLIVRIPNLTENTTIVPGSVALLFDLKLTDGGTADANKTVVNNLARNLQERVKILVGGEVVQDLGRSDLYNTYGDLFLSKSERYNKAQEGVSALAIRKHRTVAGDKASDNKEGVTLALVYGTRYRMPISHPLIDQHGALYPHGLRDTISFEITLPDSSKILTSTAN